MNPFRLNEIKNPSDRFWDRVCFFTGVSIFGAMITAIVVMGIAEGPAKPTQESPNTGSRWQDHGQEDVEPDPCNTGDKLDRILARDRAADERRNCKGGVE